MAAPCVDNELAEIILAVFQKAVCTETKKRKRQQARDRHADRKRERQERKREESSEKYEIYTPYSSVRS
jgi:hypothetical protein